MTALVELIAAPVATGALGILGTLAAIWGYGKFNVQTAKEAAQMQERASQRTYDVQSAQELTLRFRTLMDGYEHRITDLLKEVSDLREVVTNQSTVIERLQKTIQDMRSAQQSHFQKTEAILENGHVIPLSEITDAEPTTT